jgi:transcriptional regulator with XRE-family HTH domain
MERQRAPISQRLRIALDRSGKKQADLVRETGLDRGAISCYLSGKYEPKQVAIYALAVALDVSEAWLLGYDVPMNRTAESKKNDRLAQLVAKMRSDSDFFNAVSFLAELDAAQLQTVTQLLDALRK